ncbi:MAG TPA: DUF3160 domain-containing protein [Anaeromyxobacteraceae bacterium]|nr:DUF3160 domain-containing protein [Anaeromyxobacteraceae bacterium]
MDSGAPVAVALTAEQQAEVDRLQALLAATSHLDPDALIAQRAVPFRADLGYDPLAAVNLELVQGSALALDGQELAALAADGFVVTDRHRYPHFAYGYQTIYSQDLPVFVSADAILQAVHQSYDAILAMVEHTALVPELHALLASMRARLESTSLDAQARGDADLLLAVALSLLDGTLAEPVAGASASAVQALVDRAVRASGNDELVLFGTKRFVDWSQFLPRGHYAGSLELERYFRAMMWLGRIDLPFLQTDPWTGATVLFRRSVAAALALRGLMDAEALARWNRIDATVRAFVGEPDSMTPPEVDRLKADLGLPGDDLSAVSDEALATAIVAGAYGSQRILSQIVIQALHHGTWPLDATFLFFGQRYVFDSHVLSSVVYDRVVPSVPGAPLRMMPDPLDVAYAALANDHAVQLLAPELAFYPGYPPALESMRLLGDAHGPGFWGANLYNRWLGALRALSPGPGVASAVPAVAGTERWGRRLLQIQLASWAQLRHDTLLYAKPSYTTGAVCEFPDAYVEPNPAFFARLEEFADAGAAAITVLPLDPSSYLTAQIVGYFERLRQVAGILRAMAEHQATGTPHDPEHLAFVNRAVSVSPGCVGAGIGGWYADLFFDPGAAATFSPTIADVHTQPTTEGGEWVGRVLHVGTGYARLMVMTAETCAGPRAYAGVVSSYHEVVTEQFQRLTDSQWASGFASGQSPPDVPWLADLVVR